VKHSSLTQLEAKNLSKGKHADGQGLWLVKHDRARGKWVVRLVLHGRRREMGLGRWPDVSIAEARDRAEGARRVARGGLDPIHERLKAKRAGRPLTLKEAVEGCFEARKAQLKNDGLAGRWMSPLAVHIIPKIGSCPVGHIDQHVLKEILAPIWHEKPEAAVKALNRLGVVLKHAAALGLDVDLQATMKTRALLGKQRRTTEHIPSLAYEEAPDFYTWLTTLPTVSALALRFLMLTVARTSEVRLATLDEITGDLWTLPGDRTKTGVTRRIPLTPEAVAVVKVARQRTTNKFLFPAYKGKPLSDAAMAKLMDANGYVARPHGFRATFRTWVEEQTDTPFEVKEAVLGHAVDSGVVAAYQRSDRFDKRRLLLETYSDFLHTPRVRT
jgi:integrase